MRCIGSLPPTCFPCLAVVLRRGPYVGLWVASCCPAVAWSWVFGCLTPLLPLWCGGGFWVMFPPSSPRGVVGCSGGVWVSGLVFQPWPIQLSVTTLDTPRSHNTHEDPGLAGPIPVTVGAFETKVTPLTRISGVYHGGGWGVPARDARPYMGVCGIY